MPEVVASPSEPARRRRRVPKRPKSDTEPAGSNFAGQVSFKASRDLWDRIQRVCQGLGVDVANLGRMLFMEHLHVYESRVDELERKRTQKPPTDPSESG
jgi:hypothetical protein